MTASENLNKLRLLVPRKSKKGYLWVTLGLFLISFSAHWAFAWFDYVQEQDSHGAQLSVNEYFNKTMNATMENWQSEFLQLMWQIAGLSFLWYVGSPQSKEGSDRLEEKVDHLIRKADPQNAEEYLLDTEARYPKK